MDDRVTCGSLLGTDCEGAEVGVIDIGGGHADGWVMVWRLRVRSLDGESACGSICASFEMPCYCMECGALLGFDGNGKPTAQAMAPASERDHLRRALEWLAVEMAGGTGVCPAPFPAIVTPARCQYRGKGNTLGCDKMRQAPACWVQAAMEQSAYCSALQAPASPTRCSARGSVGSNEE